MISQLKELGERLQLQKAETTLVHDALKEEKVSFEIIIDEEGKFCDLLSFEPVTTLAEAIPAKKGKARLLLDKAEEVLCYGGKTSLKKHELFLEKLETYRELEELEPVLRFYKRKKASVEKALAEFEKRIPEKARNGNLAFRVNNKRKRVHEEKRVLNKIIKIYERDQKSKETGICSICGNDEYPAGDFPHGPIKRVPEGQPAGNALVSFNAKAFESYELAGNENCSICTHCAKAYVEGLNWLLSEGHPESNEKGKEVFAYTNRKNFGADTALVFWTKEPEPANIMDLMEQPTEEAVAALIESVHKGKGKQAQHFKTNMFYALTLSSAAARIIIRDWVETSLESLRKNLVSWFEDTAIMRYGSIAYAPLYWLAAACARTINTGEKKKEIARAQTLLWQCAVKNQIPPLWMLAAVLRRINAEVCLKSEKNDFSSGQSLTGSVTPERAAIIRLVLNRRNQDKRSVFMEGLNEAETRPAYICGRVFAVIESLQAAALGSNLNAGIRERFFTAASAMPAVTFGRLLKLAQHHYSKLKGDKPGLAVFLDKKLQDLLSSLATFPAIFSLEEQGMFALGFYHEKASYKENSEKEK